jgi:hypothetical protein
MSGSETTDTDTEEEPQERERRLWIKAVLGSEVPRRPRANALIGGQRATPPPSPTRGQGPIIGQARNNAEVLFNARLSKAIGGLEAARGLKPATDKAETAKSDLENALERMATAAKAKEFGIAHQALTEAETAARIISDERVAARETFFRQYQPLAARLEEALPRTRDVAGIDVTVRNAETTAEQARNTAETASDEDDWKAALAALIPLDAAVKTLDAAYTTAAGTVDTAVTKGLARLTKVIARLEALKLDTTAAKAAQQTQAKAQGDAKALPAPEQQLVALCAARTATDEAVTAANAQITAKGNAGLAAGSTALRDDAASAIKALPPGDAKTALQQRLAEWDKKKLAADKLTDVKAQQTELTTLDTAARTLLNDALAAAGGDVAAKKQEAYKKALIARYGLTITVPPGMTNTHFDRVYDMFGLLPVQHTGHDKLLNLEYSTEEGAAYGSATIEMGDYGDATSDWNYKEPANGFNISTLHEIGHAVDDKYGLMATNGKNAGCGGWKEETLDSVATALTNGFKAGVGKNTAVSATDLLTAVKATLVKGAVTVTYTDGSTGEEVEDVEDSDKPDTVSDTDWPLVKALLNQCVAIRSTNWPWGKGKAVVVDGRAYHESYPNQWVSYDSTARNGSEVRDYQWRAPGEWFAELYAYSWYKKEAPPSGIDKAVAKYMWRAGK